MYSVVITKVEYKPITDENFTEMDIVPGSGLLNEETDKTGQGTLHKTTVQFDIANVTAVKDTLMKSLKSRKLEFRLTDSNKLVHLVGDENYFARLKYQKIIDTTPGTFNGYRCNVNCNSPSGSSVS
jgi:hypothetical protein